MTSTTYKICCAACAVLLLAAGILSLAIGYCGGVLDCNGSSVPMKCLWAYNMAGALGIAGAIVAATGFAWKTADGRRAALLGAAACAIVAFAGLFWLIGVCANAAMSCNVNRVPISVLFGLSIVTAGIGFALSNQQPNRPKAKL